MNKLFLFILLVSNLTLSSQIDTEHIRFKNFNSQKGLSNDWVNAIAEDSRGFIWAGTRSGLNIFDGSKNTTISHHSGDNRSLSMNDVSEVIYSKHDRIIAGTWGGGVNIIDPYTKVATHLRINKTAEDLVVKSIIEDADSVIWIGTYGSGLYKFDLLKNTFKKCVFNAGNGELLETFNYCQDLCYHNDTVWVTSRLGGIGYVLTSGEEIISTLDNHNKPLNIGDVTSLTYHWGELILGTQTGDVFFYNVKDRTYESRFSAKLDDHHKNRLNAFSIDQLDRMWISTSSGLYRYTRKTDEFLLIMSAVKGVTYKENFSSFVDSRGIIWFGNWSEGLYYYSDDINKFHEFNLSSIELSRISSILPYNDSIFLIGTSYGLIGYNKNNGTPTQIEFKGPQARNMTENIILGLTPFKDKILVSVDAAGLFFLDKEYRITPVKLNTDTKFKNTSIIGVDKLKNGDIWIGSWSKGAILMNDITDEYEEFFHKDTDESTIASNSVFCATLADNNDIWIGTQAGLEIYNHKDKSFTEPKLKITLDGKPFKAKSVRAITDDHNGNLWVACISGILKVDEQTGVSKLYTDENGLIDNIVHSMIYIDHILWATTKIGLIRIDTRNDGIQNFTTTDGLASNVFNDNGVYFSQDSLLYLANGKDIIYFEPDKISKDKHKPRFFFENFLLDDNKEKGANLIGNNISGVSKINVKHNENNVSFLLSVLDYNATIKSKFAHRLLGFDDKWVHHDYKDRMIRYTNLDPGNYKLEIAKIEDTGIVSSTARTIEINIKKPIWQEWWFITLEALLILSILLFIIRLRTNRMRAQNKQLEFNVRIRTEEIRHQHNLLLRQGESMQSNVRYASILQDSLFPSERLLKEAFDHLFVFYKPKDVVSGDFYWSYKTGNKTIFAVADCTGHGVSGAFMSVLGITSLKTIVEVLGINRPDLILNKLHSEINQTLRQDQSHINDGMDISIISYDTETKKLEFSSAMNSILIYNKEGLNRYRGDRFPIGGASDRYASRKPFSLHTKKITSKHTVYLYSDGFQDQFGGLESKKYMQKEFRTLITSLGSKELSFQKEILETEFDVWKGDLEQVDDVLIIGIELEP